jgi:hypothetical protein
MTSEGWARLRIGAAFPRTSELSKFIIGVAMIRNDLMQSNAALAQHLEDSGNQDLEPESFFHFYLSCAQFREAAKFLGESLRVAEILQFTHTLPVVARQHLQAVQSSFEPWNGSFVQRVVKPLRDKMFHYPTPASPEWEGVLTELDQIESGVRVGPHRRQRDLRYLFADELRAGLMFGMLQSDERKKEVSRNLGDLSGLIASYITFADAALLEYINQLPPGIVTVTDPE